MFSLFLEGIQATDIILKDHHVDATKVHQEGRVLPGSISLEEYIELYQSCLLCCTCIFDSLLISGNGYYWYMVDGSKMIQ